MAASAGSGAVMPYNASGASTEDLRMLDSQLRTVQGELSCVEGRIKIIRDERSLLEQLQTITQMGHQRRMCGDLFGDARTKPSRKIFIDKLPHPDAVVALLEQQHQSNVDDGLEGAEEEMEKFRQALQQPDAAAEQLRKEMHKVLTDDEDGHPPYAPGCEVRLCFGKRDGRFLGCAVVVCASTVDAERTLRSLNGRWSMATDEGGGDTHLVMHFMDDSAEPRVTAEGPSLGGPNGVSKAELQAALANYGDVKSISLDERSHSATIVFQTIEDAYIAISALHGGTLRNLYEVTLEGGPDDQQQLTNALASMMQVEPTQLRDISCHTSGSRHVLCVEYDGDGEDVLRALSAQPAEGEPRVTDVQHPKPIGLRLPRQRQGKIGPEQKQQLAALEDQLKLGRRKADQLEHELQNVLLRQLAEKTRLVQDSKGEFEEMKRRTGWDKRKQYTTRSTLDNPNNIHCRLIELTKLKGDQESLKKDSQVKSLKLEALCERLRVKPEIAARHAQIEAEHLDRKAEYQEKADDVRTLRRILWKKEKRADKLHVQDDTKTVKALEGDKKVLGHEIQKSAVQRREKEKTIQAQHHRIIQLEARIKAVADALRQLDDHAPPEIDERYTGEHHPKYKYRPEHWKPGDEDAGVSADEYEVLQRRLVRDREQLRLKDLLMMEKDANIEALEKRVEILAHARRTNLVRASQDQAHLQRQHNMFSSFQDQQAQEAEERKEELLAENRSLRESINKIKAALEQSA
eukprot:TRINITY_DN65351_c0_g1_i1.p1 TRINITY_DN65351_c0_g1~~TRINITY_DN65351_c0_g1_i1.p1  ORF type:complete len:745 (+),score=327.18 TRINITY_DN65351_c0_g1_i1:141-2375(+)